MKFAKCTGMVEICLFRFVFSSVMGASCLKQACPFFNSGHDTSENLAEVAPTYANSRYVFTKPAKCLLCSLIANKTAAHPSST